MQHHITKLCADSLRTFLNVNYGINLKSGHAHEMTAAVFGYNSSIALHQDSTYPMEKLAQADFIVLVAANEQLHRRLQRLEGLPENLPSSDILVQCIYSVIKRLPELSEKVQPSLRELATILASERLRWRLKPLGMAVDAFDCEVNVEEPEDLSEVTITVTFDNATAAGKRSRYCTVSIRLHRVAGNVGYGVADVRPTFYTGQFHDPDFNRDFGFNSGR